MANPYFIVNTDGVFEPFDMYVNCNDTVIPPMPQTREETDTIAGRDGAIPLSITFEPRVFDFVLRSKDGLTIDKKNDLKDTIKAKLNATRNADVELLFIQTRRTYYVRYSGQFEILEEHPDWFECRVPLKAYDPYGYEAYDKKFRGTINLKNYGNDFAYTVVEIAGSVVNPSFVANQDYYVYNGTVLAGETLIIDSESQTAFIRNGSTGAERNVTGDWCGRFLILPAGVTSILAGFNVNIKWKARWI